MVLAPALAASQPASQHLHCASVGPGSQPASSCIFCLAWGFPCKAAASPFSCCLPACAHISCACTVLHPLPATSVCFAVFKNNDVTSFFPWSHLICNCNNAAEAQIRRRPLWHAPSFSPWRCLLALPILLRVCSPRIPCIAFVSIRIPCLACFFMQSYASFLG